MLLKPISRHQGGHDVENPVEAGHIKLYSDMPKHQAMALFLLTEVTGFRDH